MAGIFFYLPHTLKIKMQNNNRFDYRRQSNRICLFLISVDGCYFLNTVLCN